MSKYQPSQLISWLKVIDVEYANSIAEEIIAALDINDPKDTDVLLERVFVPYFNSLNPVSKRALLDILDESYKWSEDDIAPVFARITPASGQAISLPRDFLHALHERIGRERI